MRLWWITVGLIFLSTQVLADSNGYTQVEQELLACAAQSDKLDRLVCYDALAVTVQAMASDKSSDKTGHKATDKPAAILSPNSTPNTTANATASPNAAAVTSAATAQAAAEQRFGNQYLTPENDIDKLYLVVASVSTNAYGALKISFDNGQIWKQSDSRRFKVKTGDTVFIEKAALGSFILGKDDRNSTIRVKRTK